MEVIEHVADPQHSSTRSRKRLAPDGLLILSTPNATGWSKLMTITLAEGLGAIPKGTHDFEKFIAPERMKLLLADAGLDVPRRRRHRLEPDARAASQRGSAPELSGRGDALHKSLVKNNRAHVVGDADAFVIAVEALEIGLAHGDRREAEDRSRAGCYSAGRRSLPDEPGSDCGFREARPWITAASCRFRPSLAPADRIMPAGLGGPAPTVDHAAVVLDNAVDRVTGRMR